MLGVNDPQTLAIGEGGMEGKTGEKNPVYNKVLYTHGRYTT